ncbi:MAG: ArnT family glycosyltransferase [Patescibacteria group bacterium]
MIYRQRKSSSKLIVISLAILSFLVRLPFLSSVVVFDELGYLGGVVAVFQNNLNPFIEYFGYKPPITVIVPAILFRLFSPSRVWARLYIAVFSLLAIGYAYLLGKRLYGDKVGLWSAVLLFFFPIFFFQSFLFTDAVLLTAFTLATLYYYFTRNKVGYVIAAGLMVLTKEPAIFLILILALYEIFLSKKKALRPAGFKEIIIIISPLFFFLVWVFLNKKYLGWFFWPYNFRLISESQVWRLDWSDLGYFRRDILSVLLRFYSWPINALLLASIVFSIVDLRLRRKLCEPRILLFTSLFTFYFIFYHITSVLSARYLLFVYPLVFIIFCYLADLIFVSQRSYFVVMIMAIMTFISWPLISLHTNYISPEDDLGLFAYKIAYRKTMDYLSKNAGNAALNSTWPYTGYWTQSINGYVKTAGETIVCSENVPFVDCLKRVKAEYPYSGGGYRDIYLVLDAYNENLLAEFLPYIRDNFLSVWEITPRELLFLRERIEILKFKISQD